MHIKRGKKFGKCWAGPDRSLEISLLEYGIAWRATATDYFFYYGIQRNGSDYIVFDWGFIPKNCDTFREYSWINWPVFLDSIDLTEEYFKALPLPQQIAELYKYWGAEEIFGTPNWEGFAIKF